MFGELINLGLNAREAALFCLYVQKMRKNSIDICSREWGELLIRQATLEDLLYGIDNLNK
jgi:hypothetical protein